MISKLGTWGTNNTLAQRVLQNLGVVTACTTGFTVRFRALMAVIFSCFIKASLDGEGAGKATSNYFGPWQGERQACASMPAYIWVSFYKTISCFKADSCNLTQIGSEPPVHALCRASGKDEV